MRRLPSRSAKAAAQTIAVDGSTNLNGMDFVGTEESDAFFDDIVASTGNVDFSNVSLTKMGVQLANNTGLSQTVSANSNSQLFGGEFEFFDASGGTNDIFDYVSALKAGDGTVIRAGAAGRPERRLNGPPRAAPTSRGGGDTTRE